MGSPIVRVVRRFSGLFHPRHSLVVPKQQLLIFLQYVVRDFFRDSDDCGLVTIAPTIPEAGSHHVEPKLLQYPPRVNHSRRKFLQKCLLANLLQFLRFGRVWHESALSRCRLEPRIDLIEIALCRPVAGKVTMNLR